MADTAPALCADEVNLGHGHVTYDGISLYMWLSAFVWQRLTPLSCWSYVCHSQILYVRLISAEYFEGNGTGHVCLVSIRRRFGSVPMSKHERGYGAG